MNSFGLKKEAVMAKFLFVLNQDNNESATRCFQFAKIAHEKGHHVDLFFINDGVMWANKDRDLTVKTKGRCNLHLYLDQREKTFDELS